MSEASESISALIQHAKNYPLLKPDEERKLTNLFSFYSDVLYLLVLTEWKENFGEFLYFYKKRKEILDKLVLCNIRLVIKIAKAYTDLGIPFEELINEGIDGLIHGICLFKPDTGNKLSTYVTWWINQVIRRALENKSGVVRLPNNILGIISRIKRITREYLAKCNRLPIPEEYCEELAKLEKPIILTVEQVSELGRLQFDYVSLDETNIEDENLSLISYLEANIKYQPEEVSEGSIDKSKIRELLLDLSEDERNFLILKFGFIDDQEHTIKEMSQIYKLTIKETKDKEFKILEKLRKASKKSQFNFY